MNNCAGREAGKKVINPGTELLNQEVGAEGGERADWVSGYSNTGKILEAVTIVW